MKSEIWHFLCSLVWSLKSAVKSEIRHFLCSLLWTLKSAVKSEAEQNLCSTTVEGKIRSRGKFLQSTLHTAVYTSDDNWEMLWNLDCRSQLHGSASDCSRQATPAGWFQGYHHRAPSLNHRLADTSSPSRTKTVQTMRSDEQAVWRSMAALWKTRSNVNFM